MNERYLKFIPSDEAFWLLDNKPNAFRLLTHIANSARRKSGHPDGLLIGQCHLKHWSTYNLTEQEYRTAKKILVERQHIKIITTNRTCKKSTTLSTTLSTTKSTIIEICSSTIYDINPEMKDDLINDLINDSTTTFPQCEKLSPSPFPLPLSPIPLSPTPISPSTLKKEKEKEDYAQTAARLRTRDFLSFDFEKWEFSGITEKDMTDWRLMYPHLDLKVEILKAAQWIKTNPTKGKKKLWRKYLTGWLQRGNDSAENKKAYKAATVQGVDRRTKDMQGNPVENQYAGKF